MLRELTEVAERLRSEKKLPPTGYKPKHPNWIINLGPDAMHLEGRYTASDLRHFFAPDRQRSGKPSETNLKPYLLLDDARYALGKPESGKEEEARLLNRGFVQLLKETYQETGLSELRTILDFLRSPEVENVRRRVAARDLVAFRVEGRDPAESAEVQEYWTRHLSQELVREPAHCGVCGTLAPIVSTLPREVVILGQKCQITSFNLGAFRSFGRRQTSNAPLCFRCASDAVDALDYLTRTERNRRPLMNDPQARGLENQLAVFWLRWPVEVRTEETIYDLEALLGSPMGDGRAREGPPPEISQLQSLLALPWTGSDRALNVADNGFYLAVLSANKGRLVVREWFSIDLARLKENLGAFLGALRITNPWGTEATALPISALLGALEAADPGLTRGLLRTAYLGHRPPQGLRDSALRRFRIPKTLKDDKSLYHLAAVLKLVLTYGKEESKTL